MERDLIISDEIVFSKIYIIRDQKVMLDRDLAILYGIETKRLKEQVRRNIGRFPKDFMFELSKSELESLRSQFATSKKGGVRYAPMVFTEQGVAMLSSVLNSETAIKVNIHVIRVFTKMREMLSTHKEIIKEIENLKSELKGHDQNFDQIFKYLKQLIKRENAPRTKIGFKTKAN